MNKIEKYITEATSENTVAKMIQKQFGVKVKKVEVKRKIVFHLTKGIEEDFDNIDMIDDIHALLKKAYKGQTTTKHDWDRFTVEEL